MVGADWWLVTSEAVARYGTCCCEAHDVAAVDCVSDVFEEGASL